MATHFSGPAAGSANPSSSASPLTDEMRAGALLAFLQVQAPRFTYDEALEVVSSLRVTPREDSKTLAKRLRKALQARRIALKQVSALHAAARLNGHSSWHTDNEPQPPRLRFYVFDDGAHPQQTGFTTWNELAVALRLWTDKLLARGQVPLGVLTMSFTGRALNFSVPVAKEETGDGARGTELWPLGGVTPISETEDNWLADAPAALEKLRRHLEETGKAVLDGYSALYLCANSHDRPGDLNEVTAADVVNSELVLMRESDEDDPHSGYEIARGDELTCWHQLELSLRADGSDRRPERVDIIVPAEGVGAWLVNGTRHVWAVETLKPNEFVPGRVYRQLGIPDCERLLRRYKLAKRIHSAGFRHHDMTKRVDYLSRPPETWRVNLHKLLHVLEAAGLTWDGYISKFEVEPQAMEKTLPVGFVMQMLEDLKVENPNSVFAWPTLAEMAQVTDDRLLSSLMPRVEAVRHVYPRDLAPEVLERLNGAIDDFASGLHLQKLQAAGALPMERELPYLVHANDAQEFRLTAEAVGLQMHVAVSPHLFSTKGLIPAVPGVKSWPWAFGHALLVRFEHSASAK